MQAQVLQVVAGEPTPQTLRGEGAVHAPARGAGGGHPCRRVPVRAVRGRRRALSRPRCRLWVLQLMRDVIETEFVRQYMQSDDVGLPPAGERTAEGMVAWVESHRCDATFSFVWDLLTAMKVRRPCPLLPRPLCHTRRRACPVVCCEAPRWAWLSVACAALQDLELFHEGMRTNNLDAIETARTGLLPWAFATGRHEYGPIGVLQQAMYGPGLRAGGGAQGVRRLHRRLRVWQPGRVPSGGRQSRGGAEAGHRHRYDSPARERRGHRRLSCRSAWASGRCLVR